jgi:hypothetical protein
MGYRILGMALWKTLRWFVRREAADITVPKSVRYAAGFAIVAAVAAVVLSRREGSDE